MIGQEAGEQFRQRMIFKYENTVTEIQNVYTAHACYNERMVCEYQAHVQRSERERELKMEQTQFALQDAQREYQQVQMVAHHWQTQAMASSGQASQMRQEFFAEMTAANLREQ